MTQAYLIAYRDNAIRQMNYFHEDKNMYTFWRNVYRHYQNKIAEMRHAAFFVRNEESGRI
ncbi:hypothetical protein JO41_12710 [Treponema sp. OMZ 838]|uniref:hypothetical protein n=1 Tax=Treponema sp. OMZ 838 TaxID=1539298 RepID=UPI00053012A4|nr:hypothetical protein [Treponema sp. OMZ 838]AIW90574.1 hypothetical protein JO41_12710 [Treponema sp. OMZ 838]